MFKKFMLILIPVLFSACFLYALAIKGLSIGLIVVAILAIVSIIGMFLVSSASFEKANMNDFPTTRAMIVKLDGWLHTLAVPYFPLHQVRESDGGFRWEFRERSPYVVLLVKSVRMISGIKAALLLADEGFVTESPCLLRIVSDLATEIMAIAEGLLSGELTSSQQKFVDQFFEITPDTPEEYERMEKQRYVSRNDLLKSYARLVNKASQDAERMLKLKRFLNKGYDGYVHGAYLTGTELYHGGMQSFITGGINYQERLRIAKIAVSGKLHEVIVALELIALVTENKSLKDDISEARRQFDESGEYSK
jgi:hypothetical protein